MQDIKKLLARASEQGIISSDQQAQMEKLLVEQSAPAAIEPHDLTLELAKDFEDRNLEEVDEAPRLVRGFHDVLITIGLLTALGGLWALGSSLAVIPAVAILAEIFVRRQNLALPAFVLTLVLTAAVQDFLFNMMNVAETPLILSGVFLTQVLALGLFYWRYRVPVALASLIIAGFLVAFFLAISAYQQATGIPFDQESNARIFGLIGLLLAAGLFWVALRYDLKDRNRITRRSDVAFWLHLATAPLLLYSMFLAIFGSNGFWWSSNPTASDAIIAIVLITIMILVGIIIDRRAFVTSGLLSLGVALYTITASVGITLSSIGAFSFLAVGIIVLLLGTGWHFLRKTVVRKLPEQMQAMLPPVSG
ncbi:MAG: hypothetical protein WBC71_13830 [Salaquimonas sp.]